MTFLEMTDKLVSISDFSQGKAGKIFNDVVQNDTEYIVLKNNQPTAVVVSVNKYKDTLQRLARLEHMLESIENMKLLELAKSRAGSDSSIAFEDILTDEGLSLKDLEKMAESVEIE